MNVSVTVSRWVMLISIPSRVSRSSARFPAMGRDTTAGVTDAPVPQMVVLVTPETRVCPKASLARPRTRTVSPTLTSVAVSATKMPSEVLGSASASASSSCT